MRTPSRRSLFSDPVGPSQVHRPAPRHQPCAAAARARCPSAVHPHPPSPSPPDPSPSPPLRRVLNPSVVATRATRLRAGWRGGTGATLSLSRLRASPRRTPTSRPRSRCSRTRTSRRRNTPPLPPPPSLTLLLNSALPALSPPSPSRPCLPAPTPPLPLPPARRRASPTRASPRRRRAAERDSRFSQEAPRGAAEGVHGPLAAKATLCLSLCDSLSLSRSLRSLGRGTPAPPLTPLPPLSHPLPPLSHPPSRRLRRRSSSSRSSTRRRASARSRASQTPSREELSARGSSPSWRPGTPSRTLPRRLALLCARHVAVRPGLVGHHRAVAAVPRAEDAGATRTWRRSARSSLG